jgi:hypothetical protein
MTAMEIATVNEGLHYGLVFDVIKYLADQCNHFPVDHTHDAVSKRPKLIGQQMKHEFNRIEFRTSCWEVHNLTCRDLPSIIVFQR